MPNLNGLFTLWVKPFEIFCQPHSSVLFAIFLATERCLCYAKLVWIIYFMSQAFRNLLSTTQFSSVCYFLSNWKVSMLCQSCMDYLHFESSTFKIFYQPHNWVLFPIFLATERCLCYANLVWIIYILIQAFLNLLSTTQLSFVCYFLSNWKVSMLCQTCMDYFHIDSSLSNSFVNHTIQFCLLFLRNWNVSMLCQTCMDCFHYESSLSKSFVTTQLSFVCYFLSNWKVSMLCQSCMDYLHFESSLSKSFVNHTAQFCLLFS